jgi:hypothetical protein
MLAGCILVLCAHAFAQGVAADWFPMDVGNQWVYARESRGAAAKNPHIVHWQTVETITGLLTIPEGTVVLRRVEVKIAAANSATAPSSAATLTKVAVSWTDMPLTRDAMKRVSGKPTDVPATSPAAVTCNDWKRTRHMIVEGDAPIASLIPISRVLRITA